MRSLSMWSLVGMFVCAGASAQPASNLDPVDDPGALSSRGGTPNGSDSCASATPITGAGTFNFDNANATTDGLAHAGCLFFGRDQIGRDIWYEWTATCTGAVNLSTCAMTTVDTKVAVYAPGAPCPPTDQYLVTCDDDSCDLRRNDVTFFAIAGQRYLIRLGNFPTSGGEGTGGVGTFTISCAEEESLCDADFSCQQAGDVIGYSSYSGFRCADNFTAPATGVVTSLCFWGTSFGHPPVDEFVVKYYRNLAGKPGALLATYTHGVDLAMKGRRFTGDTNAGLPEVEYSVHHPPFPVNAGQAYWVEIRNEEGASWFWSQAASGGGVSWQDDTIGDSYENAIQRPNLGFCLGFESTCPTDINNNGVTDFGDLNAILVNFGFDCD